MNLRFFLDSCHAELVRDGNFRRLSIYDSLYNSLLCYTDRQVKLTLHRVFDRKFLLGYQHFLQSNHRSENTIAFYINNLRGIYVCAVAKGCVKHRNHLFDGLMTRGVPTRKRDLSPKALCKLMDVDLSAHDHLQRTRNLFMLAFHLQGIPFVDLCHLKAGDLSGDCITYYRRKTSQRVEVRLSPEALAYIESLRNTNPDAPYLLDIVTQTGKVGYRQYQSALRKMNRHLKEIARLAGVDDNLSTYSSRHSWASLAYHAGIDVAVVGQGLGHKTEEVTRTYLSDFAPDYLLEANLTVAHSIYSVMAEGGIEGATPEQVKEGKEKARQKLEQIQQLIDRRPPHLRTIKHGQRHDKWVNNQRYKPKKE